MKVQIVYPLDGWILEKLGKLLVDGIHFATGSPWKPNNNVNWDLTFFMNYALYKSCNSIITGGYFTHEENETFKEIALKMDFAVSSCLRYKRVLDEIKEENYVIYLPVHLKKLKPKLVLGFVGRFYPSERKGPKLLKKISKLPFITLKSTNGEIPEDKIEDFYNSLDYVLITSKIEGGPMCLTEGLACGKEIITTDVGMVPELQKSKFVHVYDRNNFKELIDLLTNFYEKRLNIRKCVEEYTIKNYVKHHTELFIKMIDKFK